LHALLIIKENIKFSLIVLWISVHIKQCLCGIIYNNV